MKKLLLIGAVAVCVFGYWYSRTYVHDDPIVSDPIAMANIEALTTSEETTSGQYEYPDGYPYISTCNVVVGKNLFGVSRCKVDVITCQGGGSGCNSKKCPSHPA